MQCKDVGGGGLYLDDNVLKYVDKEKYLGHFLGNTGDIIDFSNIARDIGVRANTIIRNFGHLTSHAKIKLFNSCCLSLYGCELWNLYSNKLKIMEKTWRIWCRRIIRINERTHNKLIPGLMGTPSLREMVELRMICFFTEGLQHKCDSIRNMFTNCMNENLYMAKNFNYLLFKYNLTIRECFIPKTKLRSLIANKHCNVPYECNVLKELIMCRDNMMDCNLNIDEINCLIYSICTE